VIRTGLAGLLAVLPLCPAAGQTPVQRRELERYRDTLEILVPADTASLRRTVRSLSKQASRSRDPMAAIRGGLAGLRLGELGADPDYRQAIDLLRQATRLEPGWAYGWFQLGVAEERRGRWEQTNRLALGNRVGVKRLERATDDYQRSLLADLSFGEAAQALSGLTLALRDTSRYADARDVLRRAAAAGRSPDVLLAWGRLERAADAPDSALGAFEAALAAGVVRSLGLLELARTRLAMGRSDGEGPYFEGAENDDPASVEGYRDDLAPIATAADLAAFDAARGRARAEFLRGFWSRRDREELRSDGERLREHYRRLLYARRHFALTISRRFYGRRDAYRSGSMELDDRGVIYVRHGEPAERLRPFVFGLMPSESWHYERADGDLLFHFSAGYDDHGGGDLYDYRLVESVLDLHGASDAPADQLLLSRQSLSPLYGRMLTWGPYGAARARARERGIGQASIEFGTSTDSYELQFAHRLPVIANLVAIGHTADVPIAHFVFAVGSPDSAEALQPGETYAVRVRLSAFDRTGRGFAPIDTIINVRAPATLKPGQYLLGRAEVPLRVGSWTWRAAVQMGSQIGSILPRDTVRVASSGPGLALSDLAIGVAGAGAVWQPTAVDTAYLTPFGMVPEGSEAELYYEVWGARANAKYSHQIAVYRMKGEPPEAEKRPVVGLAFDESSADSVLRARRTLQLRRLKPGRYLLEVTVSGIEGESDVRRREFRVLKGPT
jgi:GWxTD domain-containing protein